MIDEADNGRRLAELVAARVLQSFPRTRVDYPIHSTELHGTVVKFTPPNAEGAVVTLIALYEWSFDLWAGNYFLAEEEPMSGTESEQVDLIASQILEIGRVGYTPPRQSRILRPRKPLPSWDA